MSVPADTRSGLYRGVLTHTRFTPVRHTFRYPVVFAAIDLDELPLLDQQLHLFGYNKPRPFAVRDRDYLGASGGAVADNIRGWLDDHGVDASGLRVQMLTNLRTFGYVFNPVSFFYCTDDAGGVVAIADVSNTFGERRAYLLDDSHLVRDERGRRTWSRVKEMHVSPFFGMAQRYEFTLSASGERSRAVVDLFEGDQRVLTAAQVGRRIAFDDSQLARAMVRFPFSAQRVMALINLEAARLLRKRVAVHRKPPFRIDTGSMTTQPTPSPPTDRTLLRPPPALPNAPMPTGLMERAMRWALRSPVGGVLTINYPDMTSTTAGQGDQPRRATIDVNGRGLFKRLMTRRRVAIGESYVARDWDSEQLVDALEILLLTGEDLRRRAVGSRLTRALEFRPHRARANPRKPAKRDIVYHYDLGNDFYELFLDPTMTYSCALFTQPGLSLEEAQREKHRSICRKLELRPDDHLLEIGCGWGGFALTAAQEFGARVTGVTISDAQYAVACERVRAAGLEDRIDIRLTDYRDLTGTYDRIASIEMLEAIGEAEYRTFFATCDRLLADDGVACIQTISMPDHRYERYRRTTDWIKEYIFPGSLLPSLTALTAAMSQTHLMMRSVEDIGIHYPPTLRMWRQAFEANIHRIPDLAGNDVFVRTWRFYLAACEAAFAVRAIHDYQLVLTRPFNTELPGVTA